MIQLYDVASDTDRFKYQQPNLVYNNIHDITVLTMLFNKVGFMFGELTCATITQWSDRDRNCHLIQA